MDKTVSAIYAILKDSGLSSRESIKVLSEVEDYILLNSTEFAEDKKFQTAKVDAVNTNKKEVTKRKKKSEYQFPPVVFYIGDKKVTKEEVIAHIKNKYGEVK